MNRPNQPRAKSQNLSSDLLSADKWKSQSYYKTAVSYMETWLHGGRASSSIESTIAISNLLSVVLYIFCTTIPQSNGLDAIWDCGSQHIVQWYTIILKSKLSLFTAPSSIHHRSFSFRRLEPFIFYGGAMWTCQTDTVKRDLLSVREIVSIQPSSSKIEIHHILQTWNSTGSHNSENNGTVKTLARKASRSFFSLFATAGIGEGYLAVGLGWVDDCIRWI